MVLLVGQDSNKNANKDESVHKAGMNLSNVGMYLSKPKKPRQPFYDILTFY